MTEHDAIAQTISHYYDGYKTKDRALLERAFATEVAQMVGYSTVPSGKLELWAKPITEIIDRWVDPDYELLPFAEGRVLDIQIFSPVAASVVFDCGGIFMDSFQMVKQDGTWRIANKLFVDH